MSAIYERPDDYDFERLEDNDDIHFYCDLARRLNPSILVELGCGTGRITVPLAENAFKVDSLIVGVDSSQRMLDKARARWQESARSNENRLQWVQADMRSWRAERPADLVIVPCSSISHLLSMEDQLQLWRTTYENLVDGGRFVVEAQMPNFAVLAESQHRLNARLLK